MEELSTLEILKRVKVDPNCDDDTTCDDSMVYRTADGKCNNLAKPLQGSAGIQHVRLLPNNYTDGMYRVLRKRVAVPSDIPSSLIEIITQMIQSIQIETLHVFNGKCIGYCIKY